MSLQVHSLAVPAGQPVNGERVTKIIRPRPDAAALRLQTGLPKESAQGPVGRADGQHQPMCADEEPVIRAHACCSRSYSEVTSQVWSERRVERDPPRAPFRICHEQHAGPKIHLLEPQPQDFAKPQARAVEHEDERPVERATVPRPIKACCEIEDSAELLGREHIGDEGGLDRKTWPGGLWGTCTRIAVPKVSPELPNDGEVLRGADRLAVRSTGEPVQDGSVESPGAAVADIEGKESVEAPPG